MIMSEYNQMIREHFDLSDKHTRRYIAGLNEAGQEQLITALSTALYEKIVAKVDDIDFGSIPKSRGDITRVDGFANTEQCIDIIRKLVIQYNQKTDAVDTLITAIANIKERKNLFTKAFAIKAEMPTMIYNLMVLSIERSVSLLIATCIQFVKDPNSSSVKTALDQVAYEKTMDDMLFKQLVTFNAMCKNKSMDKTLESTMKPPKANSSVREEFDVVGSILGREVNGQVGDGSNTSDMNPFGPEETPAAPVVYDMDDDNGSSEAESNPAPIASFVKTLIPQQTTPAPAVPQIAAAVRSMSFNNPVDAPNDGVEPENIPVITPTNDDQEFAISRPITEDELQEGVFGDMAMRTAQAAGRGLQAATGTDNTMSAIGSVLRSNRKLLIGAGIAAAVIAIPFAIVKIVIPFIRTLVYYFYYTTMKVSDYLDIQASLIEANANDLENSTDTDMPEDKKKKVVEKQRKTADKLRKWANKFAIDDKQATNKAKSEADKDSKEKKTIPQEDDNSIF